MQKSFNQYCQQTPLEYSRDQRLQGVHQALLNSQFSDSSLSDKSASIEYLKQCDLVLEGVPEKLQVKQDIFAWLDQDIAPDCIVASTTSTFLVTDIAKMLSYPERMVNVHWLNPTYLIPLVELSRSEQTSD